VKDWLKSKGVEVLSGLKIGLVIGIGCGLAAAGAILVQPSCATVQEYDPNTATLKDKTKRIPAWAVNEHYEEFIKALRKNKKIKVIYVKKENPVAAWTLGAGMIIGGALVILGIAIIALSQGARLWRGICIAAAGIASFLTFYMLDRYLLWACVAFAVMLVGAAIYFYCFAKGMTDKAIETNDLQKDGEWTEQIAEDARTLQGKLQSAISRRAKLVRARKEKAKTKTKGL